MLFPGNRIIIFKDGAVNKCNIDLKNQIYVLFQSERWEQVKQFINVIFRYIMFK